MKIRYFIMLLLIISLSLILSGCNFNNLSLNNISRLQNITHIKSNNDNNTQTESIINGSVEILSKHLFANLDENTIRASSADDLIAQKTNVSKDSDKDGIPDSVELSGELAYVTDPHKADTDGDGLSDLREYWWHCDPTNPDTNGDFINDGDSVNKREAYPYKIEVGNQYNLGSFDQDGDGIPTAAEKFDLGLNYKAYSSDGDRYGDGQEYFGIDSTTGSDRYPLPSYVSADPYNPAVPDIAVRVNPEYKLIYDDETKVGSDKSQTITAGSSSSNTFTQDVSAFASASVTATSELNVNPLDDESGVKVEATAGVESRTSYTFQSQSYSSNENLRNIYRMSETDLSNTKIRIFINVENIGNDILSSDLNEITLNYYLGKDKKPFATQNLDTSLTNLKPGDIVSLSSTDIALTYKEFKRVLEGQGITVVVEHFSFGEDQRYLENAKASSLKLIVKDNKYKQKYVLLNNPISIKDLFDKMNYTYKFENNNLVEFEGKSQSINNLPYQVWQLLITKYHKKDKIKITKNIEDTLLYPGDTIAIKYGLDSDGDGLLNNDEIKLGTNPDKIDTDGDGLTDGYSYRNHTGELTLGTNPLLIDTDGDFVPDGEEVKLGTKPADSSDYPNVAIIYDYTGDRGDKVEVIGKKDFSNTAFNNKASSIIVPKGLAAILYDKANFDKGIFGDNVVVFGSINDLSKIGFDGKTTSIEVVKLKDIPYLRLINKEKGSESCLLLNIDKDKEYESRSYRCKYNDGKVLETYEKRFSSGHLWLKIPTTQSPDYAQDSSYIKWNLTPLNSGLIHLENVGSSSKRNDYNICLFMDITKNDNEEVSGYKCNDGEHEHYLNWNIIPNSDGWFYLINEQATNIKGHNVCLWLNAYKDSSEEIQGYNCNTDKYKNNVLWRFVLY